ncbi:MAG TPA: hypothetical protein VFV52_15655 [Bacilli bacterium]|nr:hypothetical protein [Bacilli bacterium]
MVPGSAQYYLYLVLYTAFWSAVSTILYRTFFLSGVAAISPSLYFFLAGLVMFVGSGLRTMKTSPHGGRRRRDPIIASLALSGLLSILYANLV